MADIALSSKLMNPMFILDEKVDFNPSEVATLEKNVGASKEDCLELINSNIDEIIATIKGHDIP